LALKKIGRGSSLLIFAGVSLCAASFIPFKFGVPARTAENLLQQGLSVDNSPAFARNSSRGTFRNYKVCQGELGNLGLILAWHE
jgi:hypothetical protein